MLPKEDLEQLDLQDKDMMVEQLPVVRLLEPAAVVPAVLVEHGTLALLLD